MLTAQTEGSLLQLHTWISTQKEHVIVCNHSSNHIVTMSLCITVNQWTYRFEPCLDMMQQKMQHITMMTNTRMMSRAARMPITMTAMRSSSSSSEVIEGGVEVSVIPHSGPRNELTTGWQDPSTTRIWPPMRNSGLAEDHT